MPSRHRAFLLAVLWACAAGAAPRPGWMSPAFPRAMASGGVIYVSDDASSAIDVFTLAPPHTLIGQITDLVCLPQGLAVDTALNLYAASAAALCNVSGPYVTVYASGSTQAKRLLDAGLYNPLNVAVNSRTGTIYVADSGHNIVEYGPTSNAIQAITYPAGGQPIGIAIDGGGNLFASWENVFTHGGSQVGVEVPLTTKFANLHLKNFRAAGLAIDPKGNLVVCDARGGVVHVYAAGNTIPFHTYTGFKVPAAAAFDQTGTRLWISDEGQRAVIAIDYPSGKVVDSITGFQANTPGLAISPPLAPPAAPEAR